jgi:hypothetical protein
VSSALGLHAKAGLASFLWCGLMASSLWGGEARLVDGTHPDRVVIEASDASVDEVLGALAARFEFAVERADAASGQPVRFSGRLQGSLDEVLERLLRHEGHIIVRSAEAQSGISLVRLLEKGGGMPNPSVAGPIAALKAKMLVRERDEGQK